MGNGYGKSQRTSKMIRRLMIMPTAPVGPGGRRQDVRQVRQLLDHDDAVVAGRLEEGGDGVGDQDRDQHRDAVGDLERGNNVV